MDPLPVPEPDLGLVEFDIALGVKARTFPGVVYAVELHRSPLGGPVDGHSCSEQVWVVTITDDESLLNDHIANIGHVVLVLSVLQQEQVFDECICNIGIE
jgi:hypothetical protein